MNAKEVDTWQATALYRLEEWHNVIHGGPPNSSLAQTIEFDGLIYNFLLFRLCRPSPACPAPNTTLRQYSLKAALSIVKIYAANSSRGHLFYIWHAMYHLHEIAVFLVQFTLGAMDNFSPSALQRAENITSETLHATLKSVLSIMSGTTRRWPEIQLSIDTLQTVVEPVLTQLQEWAEARPLQSHTLPPHVEVELSLLTMQLAVPCRQPFFGGSIPQSQHLPLLHGADSTVFKAICLPVDESSLQHANNHPTTATSLLSPAGQGSPPVPVDRWTQYDDLWQMSPGALEDLFGALNYLHDIEDIDSF